MNALKAGIRQMALVAPVAVALLWPVPAYADVEPPNAPPPDGVTLEVTANGSGCKPGGTVQTHVDRDNNGFGAYFDELFAMTGDGAGPTAARRNCQFNLRVNGVPDGLPVRGRRRGLQRLQVPSAGRDRPAAHQLLLPGHESNGVPGAQVHRSGPRLLGGARPRSHPLVAVPRASAQREHQHG